MLFFVYNAILYAADVDIQAVRYLYYSKKLRVGVAKLNVFERFAAYAAKLR